MLYILDLISQIFDSLQCIFILLTRKVSNVVSFGPVLSPTFSALQEKQVVEFDNARVLVADQKIESIKEIIPLLEKISQANAPLLIITEDVTGETDFWRETAFWLQKYQC